jgi:hypothetical protein
MKLSEIKQHIDVPLTEDQEYSKEFAALILNEEATGDFREVDADALMSRLDAMIAEAEQNGKA